ncbi:MAG: TolC family protein [Candidatus Omnitrophota bacterium]
MKTGVKYIAVFLGFLLSGTSILASYAASLPAGSTELSALIDEAVQNNPRIQAVYSKWKAVEYKAAQESSLPDPMLSYGYFGKNVQTRVGPQEQKFGISQKVPFPGKLKSKKNVKTAQAQSMEKQYEAVKMEIIKQVKLVYYDLSWIDIAIRITEGEKAVLENLEKVSQKKYESNLTPQQDVIKAQIELSRMIDKLLLLNQNRKSRQAQLNNLLSRDKNTECAAINVSEPDKFSYDLEELQSMAKETRQELAAAGYDIESAEYEQALARLDTLPDFTLGVDYIQVGSGHTTMPNDGEDAWIGTVSVNIPLWNDKIAAERKEKKALLNAVMKNREDIENTIIYEVDDIYFKIETLKNIISLYKTTLIPQTEQAFDAAKVSYETGKIDFLNWLDAEQAVLQTRLAYYKSIIDYQKSIANLERVVGREL